MQGATAAKEKKGGGKMQLGKSLPLQAKVKSSWQKQLKKKSFFFKKILTKAKSKENILTTTGIYLAGDVRVC